MTCLNNPIVGNVRLAEDGGLPKANIRLWKVAKILHFLATFQVHPWPVLTFYDPVLQLAYSGKTGTLGA